jgi:transposase
MTHSDVVEGGASRADFCASIGLMGAELPQDIETLKAALVAAQAKALAAEAELAAAKAQNSEANAIIASLKHQIATLKRESYGQKSERSSRLIDQLELELEDLEATASEDDLLAEIAIARTVNVAGFTRKKPARKPFPAHLPRERVVHEGPTACACCGGTRLSKLGEDVTDTLEVVPRSWKVIQHVREKFTCRDCEKISHLWTPAPVQDVLRKYLARSRVRSSVRPRLQLDDRRGPIWEFEDQVQIKQACFEAH